MPKALICQGSCDEFGACIWVGWDFSQGLKRRRRAAGGSDAFSILASKRDRSVLPHAARRLPLRRKGEHDERQGEDAQSHEFKYQRVHGNLPRETIRFVGGGLTLC